MKLIRANFENFRLLRDLEIDFSVEKDKNLTVVRAENESGKTTILNALQWAMYGDDALPNKGIDYRLHPIDWDQKNSNQVTIAVSIDFEHVTFRKTSSGFAENSQKFRIIRTAIESIDDIDWKRTHPKVDLYYLSDKGSELINNPDSFINDLCPLELREVFFTDGDRALTFIEEASISAKRERVQKAIRSLLGLNVIENALRHVSLVERDINKDAQKIGVEDLNVVTKNIEDVENGILELEGKLENAKLQFNEFDQRFHDIDKKISAALQKGNREDLEKELKKISQNIRDIDEQLIEANKEHSDLFKRQALAKDLLQPILKNASKILQKLRDSGKIPNTTIPVLEDRLKQDTCFCGESINPIDKSGSTRRQCIEKLIENSRKADEIQSIVTNLYFSSNELLSESIKGQNDWISAYRKIFKKRDSLMELRKREGTSLKGLEAKLDKLPDIDLQGLRDHKRELLNQRDRFSAEQTKCNSLLGGLKAQRDELNFKRDKILREQEKGLRIISDLDVVNDIKQILSSSYEQLTDEELSKVSKLMNHIFLKMIGADPDQRAIIKRAIISKEFDIIVYGPNDRTLSPDRDLNGASRRALTLAFILALTKVSEFEAPNIIDTPLGMMSGYVKRSVLKTAILESSQLILFLTRSEIAGCEEIINDYAGTTFTLTNSAHYPSMLVNDPGTLTQMVLRCECGPTKECKLCARHLDSETEYSSVG